MISGQEVIPAVHSVCWKQRHVVGLHSLHAAWSSHLAAGEAPSLEDKDRK